ncbi:N-acetylmuramoyl-L-alanine amidase [Magnetospirillum sp. UT-4]|uniref:N-acetylmuramoyl-L-alanine amidase family protein n=1 Tax=Magnetospirillum sp. UT-4 TaxID=2681467 RepID=UPI00352EFE1A
MALTVFAAALMLAAAAADARTTVSGMRLGAHPDGVTRFVMDLSGNLPFTIATQAGPDRVVLTTDALDLAGEGVRKPLGAVQGVSYATAAAGGQLVLDLRTPAVVKSAFVIPPRDGQGWRFVMDLREVGRAAFLAAASPAPVPAPPPPPAALQPAPKVAAAAPVLPVPVLPAPAAAPTSGNRMVFYSPEVQPPPAPPPAPVPVSVPVQAAPAQPAPAVVAVAKAAPAPALLRPQKPSQAPMLSAQMPPLAERPAAAPGRAVPPPEPPPVAIKASVPLPAPRPEPEPERDSGPKPLPSDGKPVVVIDPGHGGVDPGAIGISGIYEKYITLAVARELKEQLEKGGRYKVRLTRDRDIFIRLRERVAIARQYGADLFISLHADSVGNPQLKGLSVYTLSQNASDSEAQALADKENKADLIAGLDLSHETAEVANILLDLAQRETMNRSASLAGGIVEEVGRETSLLGNTHRFAGFAVLKAPDVPSVLVELGYLSNEAEERGLRQPEYRARLARALAKSVDRFFLQGQRARRP